MTGRQEQQPRTIGRYRGVRRIGAGGMGEVLEGWDDQLQRPVALKGLQADVTDEALRYRLRREALATAAINHPAIAHVYETVVHEGHDWLVMEYIDGQTVAEALRSGPLRFDEVARIGEAVARALHAAHEKGLIHRDVKAENVMVTSDGHVKVLDFGLAKRPATELPTDPRLTIEGTVLGTTRAMSPEQALGRELDPRSDVFSLGSLLYEMATGEPAFRGETPAETLVKVAKGEFAPIDQERLRIPDELVTIITHCLQVELDDRPASAGEVAAALRRMRATATHGTAALPSAVLAGPPRRPRRRFVVTAAAATVALASVALFFVPALLAPDALVVAPLPAEGAAADPHSTVAVDDALRAALRQRRGVILVPADDLGPCLDDGGAGANLARQVAADELVECSLARGGESLRVTLTRVAGDGGRILWSGQAEADSGSLLHLQAELAALVGEAYADRPAEGRAPTRELSADALEAYVTGRSTADPARATAAFQRAVELAPRWIEPRLALFAASRDGWLETRASQELDACREQGARLTALAPDDSRVVATVIQLALMEGRPGDALEAARAGAGDRPGDAWAAVRLGLVLALGGDHRGADEAFSRADTLAPAWSVPLARSRALSVLGAEGEAEAELQEALRRSPDNPEVLAALCNLALRQDDLVVAERWARQGLTTHRDETALLQLGRVLLLEGRATEAADVLRDATEILPPSPKAASQLAAALWASGQANAGRLASIATLAASDRVLASDPGDASARAARALALAHLGRGPEAVLLANELQIERRSDPDAALAAALVAALVGDANTSVAALRLALEDGMPRAELRRPELEALRDRPELERLRQSPPTPSPLHLVLPALS